MEVSNEICSKLEGVWTFKDYIYRGKSSNYTDGLVTLEIIDIDGVPYRIENTYRNGDCYTDSEILYEVSCVDEYTYYKFTL